MGYVIWLKQKRGVPATFFVQGNFFYLLNSAGLDYAKRKCEWDENRVLEKTHDRIRNSRRLRKVQRTGGHLKKPFHLGARSASRIAGRISQVRWEWAREAKNKNKRGPSRCTAPRAPWTSTAAAAAAAALRSSFSTHFLVQVWKTQRRGYTYIYIHRFDSRRRTADRKERSLADLLVSSTIYLHPILDHLPFRLVGHSRGTQPKIHHQRPPCATRTRLLVPDPFTLRPFIEKTLYRTFELSGSRISSELGI